MVGWLPVGSHSLVYYGAHLLLCAASRLTVDGLCQLNFTFGIAVKGVSGPVEAGRCWGIGHYAGEPHRHEVPSSIFRVIPAVCVS